MGCDFELWAPEPGDDDYVFPETCPCCDGYGELIGALGALDWYRCRDCGATFNTEAEALAA